MPRSALAAERGAKITLGGRDQARLDVAAAAVNRAVEAAVGPLARELVPRRVNAVSPGVIVTEWSDSLDEHRDEAFQGFAQRTLDLPASSALTRQQLGWVPTGAGLLTDLREMDYDAI